MIFFVDVLIRFIFLFLLDLYTWQAIKTVFPDKPMIKWGYWGFHILLYLSTLLLTGGGGMGQIKVKYTFWFFSCIIALYIPKLLIVSVLLIEDLSRVIRWIWGMFSKHEVPESPTNTISRARFISQLGLFAGAVPLLAILNGMIRTKYNYKINRVNIPIKNLPDSFEGFTITQISDLHTGSFDNKSAVRKGMERINELRSDLIVFTGDLINFNVKEIEGFQEIYSVLSAKEGILAVLGNHDYYYSNREAPEAEKNAHFEEVTRQHATFGWKLLRNESHLIERNGEKLAILGVENWGKSPYFPQKGDISLAKKGAEEATVKILLSHDPSHWNAKVRPEHQDISLTLSGHTHGFQFGIEIPGFKWSPAQFAYPQWAGLYQEGEQYLYVNRGFGFLGFSGRVGIRPEIVQFTLVKA